MARPTGRFLSTTPRVRIRSTWACGGERRMLDVRPPLARLGRNVVNGIWRVGSMARFFGLVLASSGTSVSRFRLVVREVYFSGVLSLVIIIVSGLFVGMV